MKRLKAWLAALKSFVSRKPELSLLIAIIALFALVALSNFIRRPDQSARSTQPVSKRVHVYQIGESPKIVVAGKVEKLNVITIQAQTGGVVTAIKHKEGSVVSKGQQLITLSSTYSGGNAASVSRQIAQKQYEQSKENFESQKELIQKQREIAQKTEENSATLRELNRDSLEETRRQLSLNESILASISENLTELETATTAAENEALILSTKQLKSQYEAAVNQLKNAIRMSDYSNADDENPAELSRLQRDITLKQLDAQEKALEIGKEIALLNVKLARINESLFYPQSPFAGRIEKVHVRIGQLVSPGTPLFTLVGSSGQAQVVITVDESTARTISKLEPSVLTLKSTTVSLTPTFVSQEPTQGRLFSVIYSLPSEHASQLADSDYISVQIPVGYAKTGTTIPYIPIDAIYQTQDQAYVFTVAEGKAVALPVEIGQVYGRFVAVSGLPTNTQVILDRTVLAGDPITIVTE